MNNTHLIFSTLSLVFLFLLFILFFKKGKDNPDRIYNEFNIDNMINQAREESTRRLNKIPVSQLLDEIKEGKFEGDYQSVFYVVGLKSNIKKAGWILFDFLSNEKNNYLSRADSANALYSLLKEEHYGHTHLLSPKEKEIESMFGLIYDLLLTENARTRPSKESSYTPDPTRDKTQVIRQKIQIIQELLEQKIGKHVISETK